MPIPPSIHSSCLISTHHHQPRNHSPLKGRKRTKERRKWKGSKPPPARGCRHQYYSVNTSNRREDRGFSLLFDGQSRIREGLQPSLLSCLSLGWTCSLQLQRATGENRPAYFHQLWFMYGKKGDQKEWWGGKRRSDKEEEQGTDVICQRQVTSYNNTNWGTLIQSFGGAPWTSVTAEWQMVCNSPMYRDLIERKTCAEQNWTSNSKKRSSCQ